MKFEVKKQLVYSLVGFFGSIGIFFSAVIVVMVLMKLNFATMTIGGVLLGSIFTALFTMLFVTNEQLDKWKREQEND